MIYGIIKNHGVKNDYSTKGRQVDDFYATDPQAVEYLLRYEKFNKNILEPCVGKGAIADVLKKHGYSVIGKDITDYGYPNTIISDFLKTKQHFDGDIITNPPYKNGMEFVLKSLETTKGKVAMLLKIQFLETISRYDNLFKEHPPSRIYVFVKRIRCYLNGDYSKYSNKGSSMCFCWIVWDGQDKSGETVFKWIPNHLE